MIPPFRGGWFVGKAERRYGTEMVSWDLDEVRRVRTGTLMLTGAVPAGQRRSLGVAHRPPA